MRKTHFLLVLAIFSLQLITSTPSYATSDEQAGLSSNASLGDLESNPFGNNTLETETEPEFLKVDDAFKFFPEFNDNKIRLYWEIADDYYLYKDRFSAKASINNEELFINKTYIGEEKLKYDEYFEKELGVYYHSTIIEIPLAPEIIQNNTTINLKVSYQGCADAGLCYPPQNKQLIINNATRTIIEAPKKAPTRSSSTSSSADSKTTVSPDKSTLSFFSAIILAILGGSILNLMPCVFPVLSMKALSFAAAAENQPKQIRHAIVYSLGVILSFVAIAAVLLILKAGGSAIGWGFQLQSPLIVSMLVYVFFIMGLSLSGLVTFGTRLMGAGQSLTTRDDYRGSFFTGVLATVVASPCTAPFMAPALGFAVTQPPVMALSIFAALGFGMAMPFYLLAAFPALDKLMPRPGPWMETFKQLMAFPMYLSAIWLLWVLGHQSSSDGVIALVIGCLAWAMGFWLLGKRDHKPSTKRSISDITVAACFLIAIYILSTSYIEANDNKSAQHTGQNEPWEHYSPALLQQYRDENRPVFIDLTADWCITCLVNEKTAINRESVISLMKKKNIAYLRGDWTEYDADITALLAQFNRSGVPLYILYPADKSKEVTTLPQILTESIVLTAFEAL